MGPLFVLGSGAAFGAMGIFGKLAYGEGATVGTLLSVRFALAAALLWALGAVREVRGLRARDVLAALALGAIGYALQAGLYFAALERIDASLLSLLIYTAPVLVAVAAVALGRERLERRRLFALALACGGLVLVIGEAGVLDAVGVALGLGAAVMYAAYILVSDGIVKRLSPLVLAALLCTGAAVSLAAGTTMLGDFRPGALSAAGWGWIACLAAVSTVGAIALFFAGLKRVGPTSASILSTVEPLATVVLAFLVFGETLGALQLAGGTLVLAAAIERMTA